MERIRNMPQWMDIIWLAVLAIYMLAGTVLVPFHGDESTLVYMGRDYYYHFVEGDMSQVLYDETWRINRAEQQLRLLNGTIPKYLFGWITHTNGNTFDDINDQWDWGRDYDRNQQSGRIPNDDLLIPARMVSAVQLALAVIVYFVLARLAFNRPIAYLASLYFTLNPAVLINGRRAMMEGSHLLFMMMVLLAGLALLRYRKWWLFIILGIVSGLALAAKHPNAIILVLVFIACGSYVILNIWRHRQIITRSALGFIGGLICSGLLALFVFYSLNPAWWGDPINRAGEVLDMRNDLLDIQIEQFDTYFELSDELRGLLNFVFVANPQYFEVEQWTQFDAITAQIQTYEQTIWSGVPIGGSVIGGIILALVMGFGIVHFARNRAILPEVRWFILVWGIGIIVITFVLTPLEWQRYYLPIYPVVGLMSAYGVFTLVNIIRIRNKQ